MNYAIFPNHVHEAMASHDLPFNLVKSLGFDCSTQDEFFQNKIKDVKPDDVVILWIGSRNEDYLDQLANLDCRKILRNIDTCKSDKIPFKRELEIYNRVGFESMMVAICTDFNLKFLSEKGINVVEYPHLLDFAKKNQNPTKDFDVFISGQMTQQSYPTRFKLTNFFLARPNKYRILYLPHPGYRLNNITHNYYGQNYIDLASRCRLGVVCTGDDDTLVMKYLEFASANTLPIGDTPSNMPQDAERMVVKVSKSMSDEEIEKIVDDALSNHDVITQRSQQYQDVMSSAYDLSRVSTIFENVLQRRYTKL